LSGIACLSVRSLLPCVACESSEPSSSSRSIWSQETREAGHSDEPDLPRRPDDSRLALRPGISGRAGRSHLAVRPTEPLHALWTLRSRRALLSGRPGPASRALQPREPGESRQAGLTVLSRSPDESGLSRLALLSVGTRLSSGSSEALWTLFTGHAERSLLARISGESGESSRSRLTDVAAGALLT